MQDNTLTALAVDDIVFDSSQPRKFFDQTALDELTNSVKQVGVLQPIMVRPGAFIGVPGGKAPQRPGYVIICGERRYRAAYNAGLKEIPAIIRTGLTDDEILEIQITENLQRKDVNPMEEAVAFKQLGDKYSHAEIALKVGKSEKYVAQRLSLNGLIDQLQQFLYAGKMSLATAYQMARISPDDQAALLKEKNIAKDWEKNPGFEFNVVLWQLQKLSNELSEARFKTEDKNLYPEMGACGSCRFNSKNNPSLFEDLNKKRICSNSTCFSIKTARAYKEAIKEVIADPNVVLVNSSYGSLSAEQKAKLEEVREMGVKVLSRDEYEKIEQPDELETWEQYLESQKQTYGWDEYDESEREQSLDEWKEEYESYKEDHEAGLKEFNEKSPNAIDAFVVTGYDEGKRIKVVLKKGKGSNATIEAKAGENAEMLQLEQEIAGIKQRSKRNQELDREKVYKLMVPLLQNDTYTENADAILTPEEERALLIALMECGYEIRDTVRKRLKIKIRSNTALYEAVKETEDLTPLFHICFRMLILKNLINSYHQDREKHDDAAAVYAIIGRYFPHELHQAEEDQKARADKREANAAKRIDALKAKLKELKTAEAAKTPKADKPAKAKKSTVKK
jgi:ParB family chromosome partitioning protein